MSYRDDRNALESQRDDLRKELADIARKTVELRTALRDKEALEHELAAVEARLARHIPLLERVRIAAPCDARWEDMKGDDRARFCGSCEKNVYNLSAMARDDAERLLKEREGSICVRLYKRADGTVLTQDCPTGVRKRRRRRTVLATAGASAMALSSAGAIVTLRPRALRGEQVAMGFAPAFPEPSLDRHNPYVSASLPETNEQDLRIVFWKDLPGPSLRQERWKVYADGSIVREFDVAGTTRIAPTPLINVDIAGPMLARVEQLRPHAVGIVRGSDDSAIHSGIRVYGTGTRVATPDDFDALVDLMRPISPMAPRPWVHDL